MTFLVQWLIEWPRRVAGHLTWLAPLFARITVGWVFLWSGWGKLNDLPTVIENFVGWHIPAAHLLAPFVSAVEFFGGLFLLLGFMPHSARSVGLPRRSTSRCHSKTFARTLLPKASPLTIDSAE